METSSKSSGQKQKETTPRSSPDRKPAPANKETNAAYSSVCFQLSFSSLFLTYDRILMLGVKYQTIITFTSQFIQRIVLSCRQGTQVYPQWIGKWWVATISSREPNGRYSVAWGDGTITEHIHRQNIKMREGVTMKRERKRSAPKWKHHKSSANRTRLSWNRCKKRLETGIRLYLVARFPSELKTFLGNIPARTPTRKRNT